MLVGSYSDVDQWTNIKKRKRLGVLHATPDKFEAVYCSTGTDLSIGVQLLSGEILLQEKNSTGRRWDLNPGPCR